MLNTKVIAIKVLFQGDAKECRIRVQNMNKVKIEVNNEIDMARVKEVENNQLLLPLNANESEKAKKPSKWAKYLSDSDNDCS